MKKKTLGVVITAVVLIVAGTSLCIGGVAAAGGVDAAKDAIFRSGIDFSHIYTIEKDEDGWDIDFDGREHERKSYLNNKQSLTGIDDVIGLELEVGAAEVEFVTDSAATEITVQASDNFNVYVKNKVLHVNSKSIAKNENVKIEIPQDTVFENVEIQGNACEIVIPYIEARQFDVETDAGSVVIDELISEQAEFDVDAGEIVVNNGSIVNCEVNVGVGNFEYCGNITKYGDVEVGMGNAEFYLDANENDYNYEIECGAGNVTVGDSDYSGLSVKKMINNNADAVVEVDCGVGNVTIEF